MIYITTNLVAKKSEHKLFFLVNIQVNTNEWTDNSYLQSHHLFINAYGERDEDGKVKTIVVDCCKHNLRILIGQFGLALWQDPQIKMHVV